MLKGAASRESLLGNNRSMFKSIWSDANEPTALFVQAIATRRCPMLRQIRQETVDILVT